MRTNRHNKATSRFSQFRERVCKVGTLRSDLASTPAFSSPVMRHQNRHTILDSKRTQSIFLPDSKSPQFYPDKHHSTIATDEHHSHLKCMTCTSRQHKLHILGRQVEIFKSNCHLKFTGLLNLLSSWSSSPFWCCVMCIIFVFRISEFVVNFDNSKHKLNVNQLLSFLTLQYFHIARLKSDRRYLGCVGISQIQRRFVENTHYIFYQKDVTRIVSVFSWDVSCGEVIQGVQLKSGPSTKP